MSDITEVNSIGVDLNHRSSWGYADFMRLVEIAYKARCVHAQHHGPEEPHYGRVLFEMLMKHRPRMAEELRSSYLDPFHRSRAQVKSALYDYMRRNWDLI